MSIAEYTAACKNFAAASADWGGLPWGRYFTTSSTTAGGWDDTCDNAHGGISVAWAYRCPPEIIELEAPQEFINALHDLLELAADTGEYPAAVAAVIDLMEE